MRLGLIGFPQAGRTTLFSALTGRSGVDGRPDRAHIATLSVPDPRLDRIQTIYGSRTASPVAIEIEDLPAVVPPGGGHTPGEGAAFNAMRACDALVLVIRAFENDLVPHHRDHPDPKQDLADLKADLLLADLDVATRRTERLRRDLNRPVAVKKGVRPLLPVGPEGASHKRGLTPFFLALIERVVAALEAGRPVGALDLNPAEEKALRSFQFLSQKPHLVVFNVGEEAAREPDPDLADIPHSGQICAALERDLVELDESERGDFMAEYRLTELAGPRLVRLAYDVLNAVTFFTAAEKEAHAWTVRRGDDIVIAAGKVHSDMARGFIRAEVVPFEDLDAAGSLKEAKARGRVRTEGKDYVVQDGDVIFVLFSK